jgi:hemerythrin-like domain-containing protein
MSLNHFLVGLVQSFTGRELECSTSLPDHSLSCHLDLEGHHNIEERHFFPILAKRMPEFRENEKHKMAHKQIHDGLDRVNMLVANWKEDPSAYKPDELRAALDSFREPLYRHLAEEVYVD